MDTTPRPNIRAKRRRTQSSFMPLKPNKRSTKLPSQTLYARSNSPGSKTLSVPRQRMLSRKGSNINLPTPKLRQTRIKSPILETNSPELYLPRVSSSQTDAPWWLLRLYALYRYSCVGTFLLAIAVLVVYGWTVHSQKLWGQSYRKLQELQRDERQLMKTNEVLKNKMAQDSAKPNTGLSSPAADQTIFLPAEPWEQKQSSDENSQLSQPQNQPKSPSSLGY